MDERIKQGFTDVWRFYCAFYDIPDRNEEWDRLILESEKVFTKYKDVPIVSGFLMLAIKDIEQHHK